MFNNIIYLGRVRKDYPESMVAGEHIYLSKHSWDCGWYWGFGYVGNSRLHCHFDGAFLGNRCYTPDTIFTDTPFTDKKWWVIRDLFVQAYALKSAAEVYRYGGHQTTVKGTTDLVQNNYMAFTLNHDLEKVLNKLWEVLTEKDEEDSK